MLKPGDRAPDFGLSAVDGQTFHLHQVLKDGSGVLLVFLRHLG